MSYNGETVIAGSDSINESKKSFNEAKEALEQAKKDYNDAMTEITTKGLSQAVTESLRTEVEEVQNKITKMETAMQNHVERMAKYGVKLEETVENCNNILKSISP